MYLRDSHFTFLLLQVMEDEAHSALECGLQSVSLLLLSFLLQVGFGPSCSASEALVAAARVSLPHECL